MSRVTPPDHDATRPERFHRLRRWFRRLVIVAMLGYFLWTFLVPRYVASLIASHLRNAGMIRPAVEVDRLGFRSARFAIRSGDDAVVLPSVVVTYRLGELWSGQVGHVTVRGAEWRLAASRDGLTYGGFTPSQASPAVMPEIPPGLFDTITISGTVILAAGGHDWRIPVAAKVIESNGSLHATLSSVSPVGLFEAAAAWTQATRTATADFHFADVAGVVRLDGRVIHDGTGTSIVAKAAPAQANITQLPFTDARLSNPQLNGRLHISPDAKILACDIEASLDEAAMGGWVVEKAIFSATLSRDDVAASKPAADLFSQLVTIALSANIAREQADVATGRMTVTPVTALIATGFVRYSEKSDGRLIHAELDMKTTGQMAVAGWGVGIPAARVMGELNLDSAWRLAPAGYGGMLSIDKAVITHASSGSQIDGLSLYLPLGASPPGAEPGRFSMGNFVLSGVPIEQCRGSMALDGTGLAISFEATINTPKPASPAVVLSPGVTTKGSLAFRYEGGSPVIHGTITVPLQTIADPDFFAHALPALRGLEITGQVAADATIAYSAGHLDSSAQIKIAEAALRQPANDMELSGIVLNLTLDSLYPLRSAGHQQLRIATLRYGKTEAKDAQANVRIESLDSLFIEKLTWSMGDKGHFSAFAVRFNPAHPRIDTELFVQDMKLQEWLVMLAGDRVSADGVLSGRLPIVFDPDSRDRMLMVGQGFLHANPGTGHIVVRERKLVEDVLRQGGVAMPDTQGISVNNALIDALTDFEYASLAFDLVPEDGDITLRITTRGRGLKSNPPMNFQGITINLPRMSQWFTPAWLETRNASNAIDQRLERVIGTTPRQEAKP